MIVYSLLNGKNPLLIMVINFIKKLDGIDSYGMVK
jgi:hypothetical protein